MSIKQVRVSTHAKDQLIRLKIRTGIAHWNVLCRWAFCLSLRQPSPPAALDVAADSNVEMSWPVFGGDAHEIYLALLKERCERDGLGSSDEVLARQFRLHLHRGIGYLAAPPAVRSIADLIGGSVKGSGAKSTNVEEA
jgi:DNA sulfur modification protein DndE